MARVVIGAFNVWGIDSAHDVAGFLDQGLAHLKPSTADLVGIGFQEVWFRPQLDAIVARWAGPGATTRKYTRVKAYSAPSAPSWKCLVPDVAAAGIPGVKRLELGSGLALCVRGTVQDAFFTRFRGGYAPDSFANKGVLCALVKPYAILNTHFHDYSNDAYGGARRNNIQAIANVVRWIDKYWRVPILLVGDFNIDARRAHRTEPSVETVLYRDLIQIRKPAGRFWLDVNAVVNQPMPAVTQNGGDRAIDHVLLSTGEGTSAHAFETFACGSDHKLVRATWVIS